MKKNQIFKKCIFFSCIVFIVMIMIFIMVKYEVEGEKNLPYNVSKIFVVSTVEGDPIDDGQNIWNINIKQVNDLYFYIDKSENTDETIKQITLQNFQVISAPQKGNVTIYRPTGDLEELYKHSEQNYLDSSIVYTGAKLDELKSLEIANTGGVIGCRISLDNLGNYISNETTEITYDGMLLKNIDTKIEDIKFSLSFDILIQTSNDITYQGNLRVDLPAEDIIEKGSSNFDITNFDEVIFKRI